MVSLTAGFAFISRKRADRNFLSVHFSSQFSSQQDPRKVYVSKRRFGLTPMPGLLSISTTDPIELFGAPW